jgi:hypothetical protein
MKRSALLVAAALFVASAASAQTSNDEIAFWETVRDSRNPAELQAYIDTYPSGKFVVLAKARLAALKAPGAQPAPSPAPAATRQPAMQSAALAPLPAGETRRLQPGDSWTYRFTPTRKWGSPMRREQPFTMTVTLSSAAADRIVDQMSMESGTPTTTSHASNRELLAQGASIFSPYLHLQQKLPVSGRLGAITINDCAGNYICEAKARVAGHETVTVPAGKFNATKVIIDQEWRARAVSGQATPQFNGGRTLTVWYVPEIGRAVKYSSRLTVGDVPPIDANFDLDLISYQLK